MLPRSLKEPLRQQLISAKLIYQQDLKLGVADVYLPHGLARKYPSASREWAWQYVFPARELSRDPRSNKLQAFEPRPPEKSDRSLGTVMFLRQATRDVWERIGGMRSRVAWRWL
jgi:hypothetical protein